MTAIFAESQLAALLTRLLAALRGSAPARAGRSFAAFWKSAAGGSTAVGLLVREGILVSAWPDSLTARLGDGILNLPRALLRRGYLAMRGVLDGSMAFRLLTGLGRAGHLLLGLFGLALLVVPHTQWNNTYALLLAVAATALYILGGTTARTRLDWKALGPYLALYNLLILSAALTSLSTGLSLRFVAFHLTGFLTVLLFVSSIHTYDGLHTAVSLTGIGLFAAGLYGCVQGIQGVEIVASQQDMALNQGMPGRVFSFFDNPNNFAEILVMLIPLLLALFLNSKTIRGKLAAALTILPCIAAIGLTYSRSSWLGLGLAVVVFLTLYNWRILPVLLVLGVLSIPFLPETIRNRALTIGNMNDSSARYRVAIYGVSGQLLRDYWLRGVGLGSDVMKGVFRAAYPTLYDGNWPIHTHNNYLQIWGETGIFGLLAYLALTAGQVKNALKTWHATTSREVKVMLCAALGGLSGILLIGLAEYTWFYPRNLFLYWFLFGVLAACTRLGGQGAADKGRRLARE